MQKTIDCKVDGMTCGNCALTVTNYLKKNNAENVVVNSATGDVNFSIPENENESILFDGIDDLGYKVVREEAHHGHQHSKVKIFLIISIIFWLPLIAHMFFSWKPLHEPVVQLFLTLPVYIIGILYFGKNALRSLKNKIPNMDVLVFLSSTAAFFYSIIGWYLHPAEAHLYLFFETCSSIITLVLLGNYLEEYTVSSTASSIKELLKYQHAKANLILIDSIGKESIVEVQNDEIKVNDILQINAGEKIPTDGIILKGNANIDESMISGESLPAKKSIDDHVVGGTIVVDGNLRIQAKAIGKNTVLSQIIKLVNEAQAAKSPMQKLADKISAIFVPVVILIAALTFLINYFTFDISMQMSMMRTIAVMVIACPCAMGLATPAAIMVGMGRAARMGILVKGGDTLEQFKDIKQFVFDKTGTLTTGKLIIENFHSNIDENFTKQIIFSMEQFSTHPIAQSIKQIWKDVEQIKFEKVHEIKGIGLEATDFENNIWTLGSYRLLKNIPDEKKHAMYLLKNQEIIAWLDIKDELRPDAKQVISQLNNQGFKTILLSGDIESKCTAIAQELGITEVYAEQLPRQKMDKLDEIKTHGNIAMIGDGINDAPALAKADIGISLSDASQIAIQQSNVILLKNNLSLLPKAMYLGKHTYLTIKQNLFWAFFYNIVAIPIAAVGLLTPTWGAAIMALSDVVLVLNSLRLRYKKIQ